MAFLSAETIGSPWGSVAETLGGIVGAVPVRAGADTCFF
jgi:hypothetical protein